MVAQRVLQVVWAGSGWDRLQPLLEHQLLPALAHIDKAGTRAQLTSLQPQIPIQLSQSILSGQPAWVHGLTHALCLRDGETISCSTLADAIEPGLPAWFSAAGKTGIWIGWPHFLPHSLPHQLTVHRGFTFPHDDGFGQNSLQDCRVQPDDIGLEHLKPFFPDLKDEEILHDSMTPVLQNLLAEAGSLQAAATRLMQRCDWQLASVRFELGDQMNQMFGDCHPPLQEHSNPQRLLRYQHMVTGAYRLLDMMLARLVQLAGPEAIVLLHSDKGTAKPAPPPGPDTPLHIRFRSGHDDRGFLLLAGAGVDHVNPLFAASILDVAPTILALADIKVDGLQGRVLSEGFNPPLNTPSAQPPAQSPPIFEVSAEDCAAIMDDLRAHGESGPPETASAQQVQTESDLYLALNMLQHGAADKALLVFKRLTDRHPAERRYILHRARCHLALNQLDEAQQWANRFVETGEPDLHSHLLLGRIALLRNEPDQALVYFFQAEQIKPNDASSHCQIGDAYQRASKLEQARDAFGRALSLDALSVAAHLGLARVALEEEKYEHACDACLLALESDYRNADAHFHLGVGLAKLHKIPESIQAFETCLRLAPARKPAHQWLAQLYKLTQSGVEKAAMHKALSL